MKPFRSLKGELIATVLILTVALCVLFTVGMLWTFDYAEDIMVDEHFEKDITTFFTLFDRDSSIVDTQRENFLVFVALEGDRTKLPAMIKSLPDGLDEIFIDGQEHDVRVINHAGHTFYFLLNEGPAERFEQILVSVVLLIDGLVIGIAFLFGQRMSNRIVEPLVAASHEVARLDDSQHGSAKFTSSKSENNEVTALVRALHRYHERMREVLMREREFSADVSHELRTPLMAVHGAAEILERHHDGDNEAAVFIERIKRGCDQMTSLTDALLFLAREPSSFSDHLEPVSVDEVVNSQIAALTEIANRKGITFSLRKHHGATINAIPAVINIVIGNILKNAVKYTDQNMINVFVDVNSVVIQDFGPGIDNDIQKTLFDRFERGADRSGDGTGIGLALVRRFCDQYGWAVDFHSEKNKGTRVAVGFGTT